MWKQRTDSSREKPRAMGSGLADMISRGARRCAHLLLQEKFPADAVALTIEIRDVGLQSGSWGDGGETPEQQPSYPLPPLSSAAIRSTKETESRDEQCMSQGNKNIAQLE